ncbi:MAG: DUF5723 family protein, partial [Calditrichaceae bacterium]
MKKVILFSLLFAISISAQSFDAVSLSMAENYTAVSRGIYSMTWNPANLSMPRGNTLELNILSLNMNLYNNALSVNNFNQYFTEEGHGGRWSDSDKHAIMDLIDDGLKFNVNYSVNVLGVAFKNFAVSIQSNAQGGAELISNKKLFKTVLFGDSLTRDYAFKDPKLAKGSAYSASKISAGYSYPIKIYKFLDIPGIKTVCAGINFNYYLGNAVVQTKKSGISVKRYENDQDDEILEYELRFINQTAYIENSFPAGNGFGIDLGFSTYYQKKWQFSWSFENLFGSIYWNQNTEVQKLIEKDSLLFDDLIDKDAEDTSISIDTTYNRSSFSTRLPVKMRVGASYKWNKELLLSMDWHQGFDSYFGNTSTPQVGVAAEYFAMPWLPLRMGMSVGGSHGFLFGLGFGLHAPGFQFDYSYGMNKGMWPS